MKTMYCVVLLGIIFSQYVTAEVKFNVPKISNKPHIDGVLTAYEWKDAVTIDTFYQTTPGNNITPSEKTVVRMACDAENLYISAQCYMSDINRMRAFHANRDNIGDSDRVNFFFDTFTTKQKAYCFSANPFGEQFDGVFGGGGVDASVDMYYESKGTTTDYGYYIEMAIPFNSIKYVSGENSVWRAYFTRNIVDKGEEIAMFPIDRGVSNFFENYYEIGFEHLPSKMNLNIVPSFIANSSLSEDTINQTHEKDSKYEPELNVFFEPNSNITTVITINPDFSIIEADAQVITVNNRYDAFYEEKRPFFIEQTNAYNAPLTIFYSRQIVNPLYGAKVSGKVGTISFFGVAALDESFEPEFNDTLYAFTSLASQLLDNRMRVRGAVAMRKYDSLYNTVISVDQEFRPTSGIILNAQFAGSMNDVPGVDTQKGSAYAVFSSYDDDIWHFDVYTEALSRDFVADLGFINATDYRMYSNTNRWSYRAQDDKGIINSIDFDLSQNVRYDYMHENMLDWQFYQRLNMGFARNIRAILFVSNQSIDYMEQDKRVHRYSFNINSNTLNYLGLNVGGDFGDNIAYAIGQPLVKPYQRYNGSVVIRPNKNINVQVRAQHEELDTVYNANAYELRAKLQFHKNFWIRGILQISDLSLLPYNVSRTRTNFYPLFVYNPSANVSLYIGGTHATLEQDIGTVPYIDNDETTYFIKMTYMIPIL